METVPLQYRVEYLGYAFLEKVIGSLPEGWLLNLARFFAFLSFRILKIRRKVSLENLAIAFPEKSPKWRHKIAYRSYLHFVLVMLEFMKMKRWGFEHIKRKVVNADAGKFIRRLKNGEGAILVSGHFGNWEIAMGYFHSLGIKSSVIQQRQKNPLVNRKMRELRERWGMEIIYPRGAVNQAVSAIRRRRLVALLGDQDAGKRGIFVPFFNRMSSTHVGAAVLHLRCGAPLYFGTCVRENSFRSFRLQITPISDHFPAPLNDQNVGRVLEAYTKRLEYIVRRHPEQYFWMHRRWKTAFTVSHSPRKTP